MHQADNALYSHSMLQKGRIFKALESLLEHHELDDITVKQICSRANIGKTTFYTHFRDKYEIVQWYTDLGYTEGIAQIGKTLTWRDGHTVSTTFYFMHLDMLRAAYRSSDYNGIDQYGLRRRIKDLTDTAVNVKHVELTNPLRLMIAGLAAAEISGFTESMQLEEPITVEEFVDTMIRVVPKDLYDLLKTPVNPDHFLERRLARMMFIDSALTSG